MATSVPSWAGFIRGQVRFDNGNFADHVVIRLRSDQIAYQTETQTDIQGKFVFDGLALSTYHLTIEGQGFRFFEKVIDISMSKMSYEQIVLHREQASESNAVPPEGPAASVSAQDGSIPAPARKEFDTAQKLLNEKKDAEGGLKHLRKAIELYGRYSAAYFTLGLLYLDLRKLDESEAALHKAAELNTSAPGPYLALGALFNQTKRYEDAEKALTRGLELKSDVAEGQYELAKAYWALGRWEEAEPHAQKAVALAPSMAPAHVLLGNVALRRRDNLTALVEFKQYLQLDPKGPMATGVAQMIQKIEQSQTK
jgi:tetratricopeptide (TPR) repeat protein